MDLRLSLDAAGIRSPQVFPTASSKPRGSKKRCRIASYLSRRGGLKSDGLDELIELEVPWRLVALEEEDRRVLAIMSVILSKSDLAICLYE